MAKKDTGQNSSKTSRQRRHKTEQGETHEHDHEPGVLFGDKLDPMLAELLNRIEVRSGHLVETEVGKAADIFPVLSWYDLMKRPHIASAEAKPDTVPLAIELVRLDFRAGRGEGTLPPYEIRNPANQLIARRLYRMIELEVLLSRVEALGVQARHWIIDRGEKDFLKPLTEGKYRPDLDDMGRMRHGVLDALELWSADVNEYDVKRRCGKVGETSGEMGHLLAATTKAISNYRPLDKDKIDLAYYLAIPFLLEAKRAVHA